MGVYFSVIVAVARDEIRDCLNSLRNQSFPAEQYEILLVGERIQEEGGNVRFIEVRSNNPCLKRNRGAEEARGEILGFIDDDAQAPGDWLEKARMIFQHNPGVAGVGGANLIPGESSRKERLTDLILRSRFLGSGHRTYSGEPGGEAGETKIGQIHLSNFFVQKECWESIGGFNPGIGYGGEDSEFVFIGRKKYGLKFLYHPDLIVFHHRREFGYEYLKQRFLLRRNNGRLLLIYPRMYLSNPLFTSGFLLLTFWLILSIFVHSFLLAGLLLYFLFFILYSIWVQRGRQEKFWFLPLAFFLHHLTYYLGIWAGLLSVFKFSKLKRLRRV
ncbi:MAG: glycosyltransferase [Deltaproteobacteria bacterium]|nr:MAG: glycosyltransferase [Deltaproteobacteria bacterium]